MWLSYLLERRIALLAWLFCWLAILLAGLWPLSTSVRNGAHWLKSGHGIAFDGTGEAYCPLSLPELLPHGASSGAFSLEMVLRPEESKRQMEYLVSQETAAGKRGLVLFQYGAGLGVQAYFNGPDGEQFRSLGVLNVLSPGKTVHLVLTSGPGGTQLFVNGVAKISDTDPIALRSLAHPLLLGNSPRLKLPWHGDLLHLALYDRALSVEEIRENSGAPLARWGLREQAGEWAHSQPQDLAVRLPRDLVILHRSVLAWDLMFDAGGLWDVAENIVGFVPFGFFAAVLFAGQSGTRRGIALAILIGFAVSLLIELAQVSIPLRASSSVDLTMNTLGTAVGALLFGFVRQWTGQPRAAS